MSNAIESDPLWKLARDAVASGIAPKNMTAQQAYLSLHAGKARGIPPETALTTIHIVEGRLTMSAQAMGALAQAAGMGFEWVEMSPTRAECVARLYLPNGAVRSSGRYAMTIEDARAAGVASKGVWRSWPAAMLSNRVMAHLCRMVAPASFFGIYLPDEIEDSAPVQVAASVAPRTMLGSAAAPPRDVPALADHGPVIDAEPERRPEPAQTTDAQRELASALKARGLLRAAADDHGLPATWSDETIARLWASIEPTGDGEGVPHE